MSDRFGQTRGEGTAPRVAIVVSRYNASVTDLLLEGARTEHLRRGGDESALTVYEAPGAFEVPAIAMAAAKSGRFACVVALGCIVKGETRHDHYLAHAVTDGLMRVATETGVAVGFGVLTVETGAQARARAGGKKGNKGAEAMSAALETAGSIARAARGEPGVASPPPTSRRDKVAGGRRA